MKSFDTKEKRKTYTLSKERETWTPEEHAKFLDCLSRFGRDWKRAESEIGTKNVLQIRSHAQKYFMKLKKLESKGSTAGFGASTDVSGDSGVPAHNTMVNASKLGAGKRQTGTRRGNQFGFVDSSDTVSASQDGSNVPTDGSGAMACEIRSLSPQLYNSERLEAWMSENHFLPPHQDFTQFAEAQRRLMDQLKSAQDFLQHVLGYGRRQNGNKQTQSASSVVPATAAATVASSKRLEVRAGSAVDYSTVYTFLCSVVEGDHDIGALCSKLELLQPLEQELALLLLHQMTVTMIGRRLRKQYDEHAAKVMADLRAPVAAAASNKIMTTDDGHKGNPNK